MSRRCLACDRSGPFAKLFEAGGHTLVRCSGCRLVFQHPQPSQAAMAALYYDDGDFAERLDGDLRDFTLLRAREKLALLDGAGIRRGGDLLDVGCSSGAWLEVAGQAGWSGTGVELGAPVAERARRRGLEVFTGTLEDAARTDLGARRFSLITFWDVLEHLPDPLAALEIARGLLAPGGAVALTTPNVEGLYPRVTLRLMARRFGVWEHPELPAHLYDFSPATMERLLARAGLVRESGRTTPVPFDYYRQTSLKSQLAHRGRRGRALLTGFELLRAVLYPAARLTDRGNALFATARG
jgi:2-polyprenyl-3-methyl-5-hydroxy-6-metoxy-1,4-benzoquinol methylase